MFFFKKIKLENFRNFSNFEIEFNDQCNVIIGLNGSGKTNLLESLSMFEKGRGLRKDLFYNMINNNNKDKIFTINSIFNTLPNEVNLTLTCERINKNLKKKILVNGNKDKISINHLEEMYSIIWFLPEMERLFLSSPSLRRNFIDRLIYGIDKSYLRFVNIYKKKILERNAIIKQKKFDLEWLSQIEKEIVFSGLTIYNKRKKHIENINSIIIALSELEIKQHFFKLKISDNFFNIINTEKEDDQKLIYLSEIKKHREYDSIVGGCKIGPHKSDILAFHFQDNLYMNFCSTGQQKASILLMIIAQCKYLKNELNRQPILLFDEVCSHFDKNNRKILLDLINSLNVQTFFTGTEKNIFSFLSTKATYYYIK